jgi:hypothetical protein
VDLVCSVKQGSVTREVACHDRLLSETFLGGRREFARRSRARDCYYGPSFMRSAPLEREKRIGYDLLVEAP